MDAEGSVRWAERGRRSGGGRDQCVDVCVVRRLRAAARAAAAAVHRHGGFAVHRHAAHHARLPAVVVDGDVLRGAVVPDGHVVLLPAPAHGVLQPRHAVLQQLEEPRRLGGREPLDALDEVAQQQRALARHRVHVHQRMLGLVHLRGEHVAVVAQARFVHYQAVGAVVVVVAVHGPQAVGQALEVFGQALVGRGGVGPHGVAAIGRHGDGAQDAVLGERVQEGHVGVPGIGAAAALGGVQLEDARAFARRHRGMRHGAPQALAERLVAGVVELVLAAEEQHLVAHERSREVADGGVVQATGQLQVQHLAAQGARHAADAQVAERGIDRFVGNKAHGGLQKRGGWADSGSRGAWCEARFSAKQARKTWRHKLMRSASEAAR